ncbi:PTS sugar transporter subunit IIB [Pectinatus frisingensis]|uniref:PTS fructose transporter subunit IIB n=1 Tax=Pectinatus frisingensis TaxID=865 RepID=UPI0018C81F2E|nr:PTS fructose transporter subunit IIB [Pectinatus frisingensis]
MKKAKILSVCGSGVVSSSMVAIKLKDLLGEKGYDITTEEASPGNIETALESGGFDLIACVSPVYKDYGIPKVNAVGLLTGLSEEEVIDDCLKILDYLKK